MNTQYYYPRTCQVCDKGMEEGYMVYDSYTVCSEQCLIDGGYVENCKTKEEVLEFLVKEEEELHCDGNTFWTDWYDSDNYWDEVYLADGTPVELTDDVQKQMDKQYSFEEVCNG